MSPREGWRTVSKAERCPLCEAPDWCRVAPDGRAVLCARVSAAPPGWKAGPAAKDGRTVYLRDDFRERRSAPKRKPTSTPEHDPARDWAALAERFRHAIGERLPSLAVALGVRSEALEELGAGFASQAELRELRAGGDEAKGWSPDAGAFTFPERDGRGRVVGLSLRAPNGAKGYPAGARRGLVIPSRLDELPDPVLIVEGGSDVSGSCSLGLAAVGRPSNVGGAAELAELLAAREALVVGERDEKDDGRWPGREGALRIAGALARAWRRPVRWALPPEGAKDVRAWLVARVAAGLDLRDETACRAAGVELLDALRASAETVDPPLSVRIAPDTYGRHLATLAIGAEGEDLAGEDVLHVGRLRVAESADRAAWVAEAVAATSKRAAWLGDAAADRIASVLDAATRDATARATSGSDAIEAPSVAEAIVRLALSRFRLGVSTDGEPFAVAIDGPALAVSLRGNATALRALLAREYRRETGSTPSGSALADALTVLAGEAQECAPEPVHLRAARDGECVVLDLGDVAGHAIVVDARGWRVVDRSPVLFRRTALTADFPMPDRGRNIAELWGFLPIAKADRELLLGWLLHVLIAGEPHAILLLGGPQGAGKSTAAEYMVGLVDPSTAPTRAEPEAPRQWAIAASGSWVVALDNVSAIRAWLSDALCRAATGDGWVDRALYTDSELAVLRFLRVVLLTSIDAGALRGDLGDRIVLADLERIPKERRRPKRELDELYRAARPRLFGALLDLLVRVLAELPRVETRELPRMADYARVLAALDAATGSKALECYIAQSERVAEEVAEGDAVARALLGLGEWTGTAGDLLDELTPEPPARIPQGWPATPRALSGRLKRLAPTLRELGVEVIPPAAEARPRIWTVRRIAGATVGSDVGADGRGADAPNRRADRRSESGSSARAEADSRRSDGSDGSELGPEPKAEIPPPAGQGPARKRWGAGAESPR